MGMNWNNTVFVVSMKSMSSYNNLWEWNNYFVIIITSEWVHTIKNENGLNKSHECGGYNMWFLDGFISVVFLTVFCNMPILGKEKRHMHT